MVYYTTFRRRRTYHAGNMQGTYQGDENENLHTLMIYQSMSGDADKGEANMTITGGSLTGLNSDLIYSTNTTSVLSLNNVALTLSNDTLLRVCGNDGARDWGTVGKNGADMIYFVCGWSSTVKPLPTLHRSAFFALLFYILFAP